MIIIILSFVFVALLHLSYFLFVSLIFTIRFSLSLSPLSLSFSLFGVFKNNNQSSLTFHFQSNWIESSIFSIIQSFKIKMAKKCTFLVSLHNLWSPSRITYRIKDTLKFTYSYLSLSYSLSLPPFLSHSFIFFLEKNSI